MSALALVVSELSCSSEFRSGEETGGEAGDEPGGAAGEAGTSATGGSSGASTRGGASGASGSAAGEESGGSGGSPAGGSSTGGSSAGGSPGEGGESSGGMAGGGGTSGAGGSSGGSSGSGGIGGGPNCAGDIGSMILFQDPAEATPAGWACVSCGAADPFYERFPVGAPAYGTQGGTSEHAHAFTLSVSGPSQGDAVSTGGSGEGIAHLGHTHEGATAMTSAASHLPSYRNLKLIRPLAPTLVLPAGAIVMVDTSTAPNDSFEIYTAQNGFFIRGAGTPGTGGSPQHTHTYSVSFGPYTPSDAFASEGSVACATAHTHTVSGSTPAFSNEPAHAEVVLARVVENATPLPGGMIALFESAPSSVWTRLSETGGLLEGDFLKAAAAADFAAHGANRHEPAPIVSASSAPTGGAKGFLQGGQAVSSYQHTHEATLTFSGVDQRPPFRAVIVAKLSATGCR